MGKYQVASRRDKKKTEKEKIDYSCYLRIVLHLVNSRTNTFNVRYL